MVWRTRCHNSNCLQWEIRKTGAPGRRPGRGREEPGCIVVSAKLRLEASPGTSRPRTKVSRGPGSEPLTGSSEPHTPSSQTLEGPPVGTQPAAWVKPRVHVLRCVSPCCAWSVPHPYVCMCVCRCALTCLSFLCMSGRGCDGHAVSVSSIQFPWDPPGGLSWSPSPFQSGPLFPAGCCAHPVSAWLSPSISDQNQSWPSCPWQKRLLGQNVRGRGMKGK